MKIEGGGVIRGGGGGGQRRREDVCGGEGYMLETGTICQIGVFTAEKSNFWAPKGPFSVISHYKIAML